MVKNLPAMQTWVQSLGREDPPEEGVATLSSIFGWRIPMNRGACQATVHGVTKSRTQLSDLAAVAEEWDGEGDGSKVQKRGDMCIISEDHTS